MSDVKKVLKQALAVVTRDHCAGPLAADVNGDRVRPTDPAAVAWSSIGAIIKVAPSGAPWPAVEHDEAGWQAFLLLQEACEQQGYVSTVQVDRAGVPAVQQMYWRALQLVDPEPRGRRVPAFGTGSKPRGVDAA